MGLFCFVRAEITSEDQSLIQLVLYDCNVNKIAFPFFDSKTRHRWYFLFYSNTIKITFFIFKETNQRWHFRQQSLILYSHRQINGTILTGQSLDNNAKNTLYVHFHTV